MVHRLTNFRKAVASQPGIDLRGGVEGEIAERAAGKELSQIHRHLYPDGFSPFRIGNPLLLKILQPQHQCGAQKLRQADPIGMGLLQSLLRVQAEAGQVQEAVLLRRAPGAPGVVFPAAGVDVSRVLEEAVLQLLLPGSLQPSQHALPGGDGHAVFLLKIFRRQGFQEHQSPVSVGDGVEEFHGDAVSVRNHPEGALAHLLPGHPGQRVAALLPDFRCLAQLLQIVPEQPPPQPDTDGGKPSHGHIQRRLQHLPVYLLPQGHRKPEHIAPALPQGGGVDFRRVVQAHPPQLPLPGKVTAQEGAQGNEILLVLLEAVEHIGVPPLRPDDKLGYTSLLPEGAVQLPGITEENLIPARKNQRGRHSRQIPQQRGGKGVLGGVRVTRREEL